MKIDVSPEAPSDWDEFVDGCRNATAYHRSAAVRIGEMSFGLKTYFLVARSSAGSIIGVLPLVEQSSVFFGRFITSLPFVTYGGVLANDATVSQSLVERAGELAVERGAKHAELRHGIRSPSLDYPERNDKVSMLLALPENEELLAKSLGSKLRSQIRRAEREDPEVVWGGRELVDEFYNVFAPSMHALGTPVYPKKFFTIVMQALDESSIIVVRAKGQVEAAALTVAHGSRVEVPWAAATMWGKKNAINMRMYWEMLKAAVESGASAFDFGRSTIDSGTQRFKAQWGAKPEQLRWHYWLPSGEEIPALNHSNPKYQLMIRAWQRMPLWCANTIGPHIVGNLP